MDSNREERKGLPGPSSAPALGLGVALRHVRLVKMCFKASHFALIAFLYMFYMTAYFLKQKSVHVRRGWGREGQGV